MAADDRIAPPVTESIRMEKIAFNLPDYFTLIDCVIYLKQSMHPSTLLYLCADGAVGTDARDCKSKHQLSNCQCYIQSLCIFFLVPLQYSQLCHWLELQLLVDIWLTTPVFADLVEFCCPIISGCHSIEANYHLCQTSAFACIKNNNSIMKKS